MTKIVTAVAMMIDTPLNGFIFPREVIEGMVERAKDRENPLPVKYGEDNNAPIIGMMYTMWIQENKVFVKFKTDDELWHIHIGDSFGCRITIDSYAIKDHIDGSMINKVTIASFANLTYEGRVNMVHEDLKIIQIENMEENEHGNRR